MKIIFSIYFLFFYAIPALSHVSTERFPFYGLQYMTSDVMSAAILVACFIATVSIGYQLGVKANPVIGDVRPPVLFRGDIDYSRVSFVFACLALLMGSIAGWGNLLSTRGEAQDHAGVGALMLEILCRQFGFMALVYAAIGSCRRHKCPALVFATGVYLLTNSPLAIARFMLAAQILSLYILAVRFDVRNRVIFVFAFVIATFTVFPIISALSRGDVYALLETGLFRSYFLTGDFDGFQSTVNVIEYVRGRGYAWGHNLLSAALFFVPRSFWPEKSPGTGADAAGFVGYPYTNISAPLPSEFYVDFGYAGAICGGLLVGYLLRRLDRLTFSQKLPVHRLLACALMFGYAFIILRGALVAVIGPVVVALALVFIVDRFSTLRFATASGR